MVKSELIKRASEELGMSVKQTSEVLGKIEEIIKDTIVNSKEEVKITGFMSITTQFKESREVRNPKTGEKIMSKPHNVVKIKPNGKWF